MFDVTCSILKNIIKDKSSYSQRGDTDAAYDSITSFEFFFILHFIQEIMRIIDNLFQVLQNQFQDILNALDLVSNTKVLIQELRECGWDPLLEKVTSFCNQYDISIPDMNACYAAGRGRFRHQQDHITIGHYYRFDIFTIAIDSQLQELNSRFNEHTVELLILSSALDPRDGYRSFKIDDIYNLADKFYPRDFSEQENIHLRYQLRHYELDVPQHPELQNILTISELCQGLARIGKSTIYPLVDRLIRLVLTLPISTTTTKRAFSVMKIVKTRLRNKMKDEYLANNLVVHIEKEIIEKFTIESIIDDYYSMKERQAQLQ
ncbi:hypothetical protein HHK36_008206 [Tetracentron sinense]|uniref:HAT C-terminal dimerisation domain-containing protein n=1 Tax=Tetracentron sinense TaxID=13715 RepID=A0A835DJU2_TETSI|nr:hypothetical protein HHK36_008206 [Tetracentron sinense]